MQFDIEIETAVLDVVAEPATIAGQFDCARQDGVRQRVFGAQVDVAFAGADGKTRNRHALDQAQRVAFH